MAYSLEEMEAYLSEIYSVAAKDLEKTARQYLKDFERLQKQNQKKVDNGKWTQEEYDTWRKNKLLYGEHWPRIIQKVQREMLKVNQTALDYVNGKVPQIFAHTYNEVANKIPKSPVSGYSFELVNSETVNKLVKEEGIMLPPKKNLDKQKDKLWNAKQLNAQILQGVLTGESIPKLAERVKVVVGNNEVAAVRTARTMCTAAENSGRQSAYNKAEADGIKLNKTWLSAYMQANTRDTHRELNEQTVRSNEMFLTFKGNELEFPGDWRAPGYEVYNCRCTMVTSVIGFDKDKLKESVERQKKEREAIQNIEIETQEYNIVEGSDISREWERRPDEFEYEIEDVINAQGFDGLPNIVSEEEFNRIVQASQFIGQRTFTASTTEVLDEYVNQLYYGRWYVDCGTGGAQYGQGMYCASDYTGTLSEGMKVEMKHYQDLNVSRFRSETAEIEKNRVIEKYLDFNDERVKAIYIRDFARGIDEETRKAARALAKTIDDKTYEMIENKISEAMVKADVKYKEILSMTPEEYSSKYSKIITMTLAPDSKVIKYTDLVRQKHDDTVDYVVMQKLAPSLKLSDEDYAILYLNNGSKSLMMLGDYEKEQEIIKLADKLGSLSGDEWDNKYGKREDQLYEIWDKFNSDVKAEQKAAIEREKLNDGAWAALMGYDAINAEGHGQSGSYTVILNRTKVFIKEE